MQAPDGIRFAKSHEWMIETGDTIKIGVSDYAQAALGDLVFVNLPEVGDKVEAGKAFADVESVKAVSDVYSPVSGEVVAVNAALLDAPETINEAPYDAWFVEIADVTDRAEMMDAAAYAAFCENEAE